MQFAILKRSLLMEMNSKQFAWSIAVLQKLPARPSRVPFAGMYKGLFWIRFTYIERAVPPLTRVEAVQRVFSTHETP